MDYARVFVPAAAVREKPRHQSQMSNQLLFGEAVKILKIKRNQWAKVRGLLDGYQGWVLRNQLLEVKADDALQYQEHVLYDNIAQVQSSFGTSLIPAGSFLPGLENGKFKIGDVEFSIQADCPKRSLLQPSKDAINNLTRVWLNTPYLWGGRTVMGIDCSGLVQIIYRLMGIDLPRDAWQQAQEGKSINKLKEAGCGDLAFFDDRDEIVHVGILLGDNKIVHASGKVRIDEIDKKGIINSETGKRTHSLRVIKKGW